MKNLNRKLRMLDAVRKLGTVAHGRALGSLTWPDSCKGWYPDSRRYCGLGAAANTYARRLVKEGLLTEGVVVEPFTHNVYTCFSLTEVGKKLLDRELLNG